jgi:hypothetical protein
MYVLINLAASREILSKDGGVARLLSRSLRSHWMHLCGAIRVLKRNRS